MHTNDPQVVRKLATRFGVAVIASIHQPPASVFEMFDKVHFLSRGNTAYFGPRQGLAYYIENVINRQVCWWPWRGLCGVR